MLRQAVKLSGFDQVVKKLIKNNNILYGGHSADACVLGPTLKGLGLIDDATTSPYENSPKTIWQGLNVLNYSIVPHYQSDHPESENANETINYMINNKIPFKALKDNEVIIVNR